METDDAGQCEHDPYNVPGATRSAMDFTHQLQKCRECGWKRVVVKDDFEGFLDVGAWLPPNA